MDQKLLLILYILVVFKGNTDEQGHQEGALLALLIYIDGGSKSSAKEQVYGSVAYILSTDKYIFIESGRGRSDRQAKLIALRGVLEWVSVKKPNTDVVIVTDSKCCIDAYENKGNGPDIIPYTTKPSESILLSEIRKLKSECLSICKSICVKHVHNYEPGRKVSITDFSGKLGASMKVQEIISL